MNTAAIAAVFIILGLDYQNFTGTAPAGTGIIWQIEHEETNETAEETFPLQLEEFVQFSMN